MRGFVAQDLFAHARGERTSRLLEGTAAVYDEEGFMQIEPSTCPACGAAYDPLRAQAVTVIDGRVRAFCSPACRERGIAPPEPKRPVTDAHAAVTISSPRGGLPTEQKILIAAAVAALGAFIVLIAVGRHSKATESAAAAEPVHRTSAVQASNVGPMGDGTAADTWIQPVARVSQRSIARDRRLFFGREGLSANECGGARCAIEIDTAAGAIVMAVHDGVIEAVERSADGREEGRFIRINHKGGAIASSYFQLDGIREDLRPGIPVKAGEPIGTVARATNPLARAHFRFGISVHSDADGSVLFIDPQPLLALWPIRHDAPMSLRAMERAPRLEPSRGEQGSKKASRAEVGRTDSADEVR